MFHFCRWPECPLCIIQWPAVKLIVAVVVVVVVAVVVVVVVVVVAVVVVVVVVVDAVQLFSGTDICKTEVK